MVVFSNVHIDNIGGNKSGTSYVLSGQRKEVNVLKAGLNLTVFKYMVGYGVLSDFIFTHKVVIKFVNNKLKIEVYMENKITILGEET